MTLTRRARRRWRVMANRALRTYRRRGRFKRAPHVYMRRYVHSRALDGVDGDDGHSDGEVRDVREGFVYFWARWGAL